MLCDDTFTLAAGEAAAVAPARLARVAQRQQREGNDVAGSGQTVLDVPVSEADVERWTAALAAVAPPSAVSSPPLLLTSDASREANAMDLQALTHFRSDFASAAAALARMPSEKQRRAAIHPLAPLPPFDPSAVVNLPMTRVLKMRREWLPYRQRFAIYQERMPFLDAVLNHAVVALVGGPGCGRTLQTPLILAETEAFKRRRIVVVSANAVAAQLTVHRLREERGEATQVTSGGAAAASRNVAAVLPGCAAAATEGTSVLVTTAEVLLRQLLCDPTLVDVGCVIVDDVHIRNECTELCLAALRDALAQSVWHDHTAGNVAAANSDVVSGRTGGAERASGRLRVVLNCPDEATAAPLLEYFASGVTPATMAAAGQPLPTLRTTLFSLARPEAGAGAASTTRLSHYAPAVVLHADETVQWLSRCEREGSRVCKDPDAELAAYADHVDVVARVFAATDADFAQPDKLREFWCELMLQAIRHYDAADRAAARATAGAALPSRPGEAQGSNGSAAPAVVIVVVVPDVHSAVLVAQELRRRLPARSADEEGNTAAAAAEARDASDTKDEKAASRDDFVLTTLLEQETDMTSFLRVAQRNWGGTGCERHIVLTTPELAQTVLPSSLEVGLVIDCARTGSRSCRQPTMTDAYGIEYSTVQALRHRRAIGKVQLVGNSLQHQPTCMVLQLIPKSVLHGAAHRRYSADAAQHIVFHLPFERYVQLYAALLAHEEAAAVSDAHTQGTTSLATTTSAGPLSTRVAQVVAGRFIGVPAASSSRYETLRRIFAAVETFLLAARHIAPVPLTANNSSNNNSSNAATTTSALRLQPLGVLTLCLPYPCVVSRLLVLSTLCHCSLVASAIAAIWLTGDPFAVPLAERANSAAGQQDASAETDEERAALLNVARAFFARDTNSDTTAAFNVYKMWLTVHYGSSSSSNSASDTATQPPPMSKEEADFLDECKVSRALLLAIAARHTALLRELQRLRLWSPEHDGAHDDAALQAEVMRRVCGLAEDVMLSAPVQLCLTGALYPHCVRLDEKAADGAALLFDVAPVNESGNAAAIPTSATANGSSNGATNAAPGEAGAMQLASHPWLRRLGVLADSCVVMSSAAGGGGNDGDDRGEGHGGSSEGALDMAGQPFLYVGKALASGAALPASAAGEEGEVAVLVHTTPMHKAAALVFCGEAQERLKPVPVRCRGWTSMLTGAWRQTRKAQQLPPPAQLPAVAVPLQPYDTIRSRHVVVQADRRLHYSMRATSARWLWQLRAHVERHLAALAGGTATWAAGESAAEIANAWGWWVRRQEQAAAWLREERQVQRHGGEDKAGNATSAAPPPQLRGYYVFSTAPGAPVPLPEPAAAASGAANDGGEEDAGGAQKPAVYTGKLPSPDVDHIFRMCVKSVAAKRTREAEAQLLRDNPDIFAFLDPENEFHEYYLFLLRQAAPDMEVLGDNLDELVEYLQKLEATLREELGLAAPEAASQDPAAANATAAAAGGVAANALKSAGNHTTRAAASSSIGEGTMVEDEVMSPVEGEEAGYYAEQATGLQLETAAVSLKRRAAPTLAAAGEEVVPFAKRARYDALQHDPTAIAAPSSPPPPTLPPQVALPMMPQSVLAGDPTAVAPSQPPHAPRNSRATSKPATGTGLQGIGNFTFATPATTTTSAAAPAFVTPGAAGREPTLMEKLMAMQSASNTAPPGNAPAAAFVTPPPTLPATATPPTTSTTPAAAPPMMSDPTAAPAAAAEVGDSNDMSSSNNNVVNSDGVGFVGIVEAETTLPAPPTTAELMALLANTATSIAPAAPLLPAMAPMLPPNPLTRPPPPLPRFALDSRTPSVLVYPLPEHRYGNLTLILARALSQTMTLRVGPARILGRVARIEVPNRNVEARALSLKSFTCLGQKLFILRNDRIIDNPNAHRAAEPPEALPPWPHYKQQVNAGGTAERANNEEERRHEKPVSAADMTTTTVAGPVLPPPVLDQVAADVHVSAPDAAAATGAPVMQIGVFSDSDDEEDDEDEEEDDDKSSHTSSSSSSSSSSTEAKSKQDSVASKEHDA